jgi:hypothetical protein
LFSFVFALNFLYMKNILLFKKLSWLLFFVLLTQLSFGQTYTKITNLTDLTDGEYVIVANSSTKAMNSTLTSGKFGETSVSVTNNSISSPVTGIIWTITTVSGNIKNIHNTSGYVNYSSGTNFSLATGGTLSNARWTASYNNDGYFRFNNTSSGNTSRIISYNGSAFGAYSSSNATNSGTPSSTNVYDVQLYKKVSIPSYTLTYTAVANGSISGTTPQTVQQGNNGSAVTAVANEGYHFVDWTPGNSTANPRTDTNVQATATYTANFAINTYTVTYNGNGSTAGTTPVDANSPYDYGSNVTVVGQGNLERIGHSFTRWNTSANGDGTPYEVGDVISNVTSDITLYAQWLDDSLEPQSITFNALNNVTYGDADFNLTATASSGLTVSYTSSNEAVATVSGNTVTIHGVGETTITASQAGDGDYQPAISVPQTLTVNQKELTLTGVAVSTKTYDGDTSASYTGGSLQGVVGSDAVAFTGEVVFTDANAGEIIPVTANFSLTGTDAGNYTLAQPTLTGTINKADQSITGFVNLVKSSSDAAFNLDPNTDPINQSVTYTSSNEAVATVSGNTVTIHGVGSTTIEANAEGTNNYNAFNGTITLTVNFNNAVAPTATAATGVGHNNFTANWNAVTGATSYDLDVYTKIGGIVETPNVNVVTWDFNDQNYVADSGLDVNLNKTLTANGGVIAQTNATYTTGFGNNSENSTPATSYNTWTSGSGSKYWQVSFVTTGMSNLKFSSAQRGSNTGPRNFKVQFSLTGNTNDWTDVIGATITVTNPSGSNPWAALSNVSLPSVCDNQPLIYLRWIMTSNTSINNSTVGDGGTSQIDNIVVTGTQTVNDLVVTPIAGSPFTDITGTSHQVTGLSPETQYHYVVRAVNGATTPNSNEISVTTTNQPLVIPPVSITSSLCGTTLNQRNAAITSNAVSIPGHEVQYRFRIQNENFNVSVIRDVPNFTLQQASYAAYVHPAAATYDVYVALVVDGELQPESLACPISVVAAAAPGQSLQNCNTVLTSPSTLVFAPSVSGAVEYQFEISQGGNVLALFNKTSNSFHSTNDFAGWNYGTTYTVRSQSRKSGETFGNLNLVTPCSLTYPAVPVPSQALSTCSTSLTNVSSLVFTTTIFGATSYQFELTEGSNIYTVTRSSANFHFTTDFANWNYGKTYSVRTRVARNDGDYGLWSTVCTLTSPAIPTPSQGLVNCTTVMTSVGSYLYVPTVFGTTEYQFEVTSAGEFYDSFTKTVPYFRLSDVDGWDAGTVYSVRVMAKRGEMFSDLSTTCTFRTPGTAPVSSPVTRMAQVPFAVKAYPNPYSDAFQLDVATSDKTATIDIKVYDMLGRLVESKMTTKGDLETTTIGSEYPSGVYNVIVTQNEETKAVRVIKR